MPRTGTEAERVPVLAHSYFPELDGLRAVSILMVLSIHSQDPVWLPLHGGLGVTVFFVVSGFLITTLLVREEDRVGRVSLRRFYLRRAFRICPLYFLALAVFGVLAMGLGLGATASSFVVNLPYYATFNGDLATGGLFSHSWSLGIEEKFYLLWPVLAFAVPWLPRRRLALACCAVGLTAACSLLPQLDYLAIYAPLMLGSLVAVLMHSPRTSRLVAPLCRPVPATMAAAALVVGILLDGHDGFVHVGVALLVALAMPGFLLGPRRLRDVLATPVLRYLGTRSYAVYLFHPLVVNATGRVLEQGTTDLLLQVTRLAVIVVGSVAVAEVVHRLVERPMIRLGRQLVPTVGGLPGTAEVPRPEPAGTGRPGLAPG